MRWLARAAFRPVELHRVWGVRPTAVARLPAGRTFDVLDVPEEDFQAIVDAMSDMDRPFGPVFWDRGRLRWFVAPSDPRRIAALLADAGWPPTAASPVVVGFGQYVAVPSRSPGRNPSMWWVFPPTDDPQPMVDLSTMLMLLARLVERRFGAGEAGSQA